MKRTHEVKAGAKLLRSAIAEMFGVSVSVAQSLELCAKQANFKNWDTYASQLTNSSISVLKPDVQKPVNSSKPELTDAPSLDDLGVEVEIIDALFPNQRLVCFAGSSEHGYSKLVPATMNGLINGDGRSHPKIATVELSAEYSFQNTNCSSTTMSRCFVPHDVSTFAEGIRGASRRGVDVILVGETRDTNAVEAILEAAQTGIAVYINVVADSVSDLFSRLVKMFPSTERHRLLNEVVASMHLVVYERMVPSVKGDMNIILREYLVLDQFVRGQILANTVLEDAIRCIDGLVEKHGQTILMAATKSFEAGLISFDSLKDLTQEYKIKSIASRR